MMIPRPTTVEEVEFAKAELVKLFRAAGRGIKKAAQTVGIIKRTAPKTGLDKP